MNETKYESIFFQTKQNGEKCCVNINIVMSF